MRSETRKGGGARQVWLWLFLSMLMARCAAPAAAPTATLPPAASPTLIALPTSTATSQPVFTPTAFTLPPGREVVFEEAAGEPFTGTLYGEGETAVLLANMSIGGERQWDPLTAALDTQKFTIVTFNYRDIDNVAPDAEVILHWLNEQGYASVVCIGASLGVRACSSVALEPGMVGMVLIAGPVHHASVAQAVYPKLFLSAEQDVRAFDIRAGYEQAAEPKELVIIEDSRAHGTDLFSSEDRDSFLRLLLDFVNGIQP